MLGLSGNEKTHQGEMVSLAAKWKADEQELLETLEKEREAHKITTFEKNNLEKVMRDTEQQLTKSKEEVQNLEDKVQSLESRNSELSRKLTEEEERFKKSIQEKDDAIRELQQSLVQETAMRSRIERVLRIEMATMKRRIEELTTSVAEERAVQAMVGSQLSTMETEVEVARKEREAVMSEKEWAQNELNALSTRVRKLEEKLVEIQKAMEEECDNEVSDYEAHDAKLREELSAANEKNAQLSSELRLNVEELARLSQQLEETKSRADEAAKINEELERLRSQHKQLEEELTRVTSEKDELLKTLRSAQDKEGEKVQVLNRELAGATSLNAEYLKEKERLLADIEQLSAKLSSALQSEQAAKEEIFSARAQIEQLSNEKQALAGQLAMASREEADVKEKVITLQQRKKMVDRKAVIVDSEMSEDMQQDAVDCATQALEKYSNESDIELYIQKEFDKKHNPRWHCIVGKDYTYNIMPDTKHCIHFFMGQLKIVLFKSA